MRRLDLERHERFHPRDAASRPILHFGAWRTRRALVRGFTISSAWAGAGRMSFTIEPLGDYTRKLPGRQG